MLPVRARRLAEHEVIPGAPGAVRLLRTRGFLCPVVTVQSGVARGRFSLDEFLGWFRTFSGGLAGEGAELLGPYVCPHLGDDGCVCHKPKTQLYEAAAHEWGIALPGSFVVGDTTSDLLAARALGCTAVLVRTGWGEGSLERATAEGLADYVAADIAEAAAWIVNRQDGQDQSPRACGSTANMAML